MTIKWDKGARQSVDATAQYIAEHDGAMNTTS